MPESINELAVGAGRSEVLREKLIQQQEELILRTASRVSYRYITKSDDEWSIALCAFSDAIDKYSLEKGNFIPFSQLLIKRALIDYHRSTAPYLTEISTSPFVLEGTEDLEEADSSEKAVYRAVSEQSIGRHEEKGIQEEIVCANDMLSAYGFRFYDLTECSPRQEKTKKECAKAIRHVLSQHTLFEELIKSGKLPIRKIASGSGVSKKVLDRYRKYLIMAILILQGDYPNLSEYLKYVWKEEEQ